MTLGEFRKHTNHLSDDLDIMIEQTNDESLYGLANQVSVEIITFGGEDIPRKEWAKVKCLVITDGFL